MRAPSKAVGRKRLDELIRSLRVVAANMRCAEHRRIASNNARYIGRTNVEFAQSKRGEICRHARAFMKTLPDLAPEQLEEAARDAREFANMLSAPLIKVSETSIGRRVNEYQRARA